VRARWNFEEKAKAAGAPVVTLFHLNRRLHPLHQISDLCAIPRFCRKTGGHRPLPPDPRPLAGRPVALAHPPQSRRTPLLIRTWHGSREPTRTGSTSNSSIASPTGWSASRATWPSSPKPHSECPPDRWPTWPEGSIWNASTRIWTARSSERNWGFRSTLPWQASWRAYAPDAVCGGSCGPSPSCSKKSRTLILLYLGAENSRSGSGRKS
jgi:hypothetical protein